MTKEAASHDVIIVGAGISGSLLAYRLVQAERNLRILLLEQNEVERRGLAYGTSSLAHLLNVRASHMSILPEQPGHFLDWLQSKGLPYEAADFVPRCIFREYINGTFADAELADRIEIKQFEAVQLERNLATQSLTLQEKNGDVVHGKILVLSLGNLPFSTPSFFRSIQDSSRYIKNPYQAGLSLDKDPSHSIFLLGSSLTALDVILESERRGFQGSYTLLSRHGLLPLPHLAAASAGPSTFLFDIQQCSSPLCALRYLRSSLKQEDSWQHALDSLRDSTQSIWKHWTKKQQQQFLRHLRTYWDIHRHRIPHQSAELLKQLHRTGRLQLLGGRIQRASEVEEGISIEYVPRGEDAIKACTSQVVVNCTGPSSLQSGQHTFIKNLLGSGFIRADELAIGIDSSDDGRVLTQAGKVQDDIWTIGPLRRGTLWESVALREIRVQAKELCDELLRQL